ncbi:hypothetical protein TNCV_594821 [Trichonephila clavipes]|nr:hypothetical protein TNCV_594821 [Trichonephila clavipes]
MEQQLVNVWHKKGLHLAQDGVVRKSIGKKTSALPQSWELSSSTEEYGTFYEHTEVSDVYGLSEGNARATRGKIYRERNLQRNATKH